jgi:type III secretory pathway component EscU
MQTIAIVMFIVMDHMVIFGVQEASLVAQIFVRLSWLVMLVAVGLTVWSLFDYFIKASEVLKGPWQKSKPKAKS